MKLANHYDRHTEPAQLKRSWKGRHINGPTRTFVLLMAAALMVSGAKASSIDLAEAPTEPGDSSKVALIVEQGKPSGSYDPGTQVVVSADAPASGAQFISWTGDIEILANPSLAVTTATIPFRAVKITATYTAPPATETNPGEMPAAAAPTPQPTATSPSTSDHGWEG
jgi:Divergent InlB B-repeat domain